MTQDRLRSSQALKTCCVYCRTPFPELRLSLSWLPCMISGNICFKNEHEIYVLGLQDGLFTPGLPSQQQQAPQKCCVPWVQCVVLPCVFPTLLLGWFGAGGGRGKCKLGLEVGMICCKDWPMHKRNEPRNLKSFFFFFLPVNGVIFVMWLKGRWLKVSFLFKSNAVQFWSKSNFESSKRLVILDSCGYFC